MRSLSLLILLLIFVLFAGCTIIPDPEKGRNYQIVSDCETISRVKITGEKRSTFVEINRGNENSDLIIHWCSKAQQIV